MSDSIFLIRSKDRTSASTSSSNFKISLAKEIWGKYQVLYVQIYNTFYSVQTGLNDTIYFNENSTNKTATLPAGLYTTSGSASILTAIGTAMTTASGGFATFTATLGASSQFITISSTQNFSLKFGTNTAPSLPSAANVLGFANSDTSAATSAVATNVPNLGGPTDISISIEEAGSNEWINGQGAYGQLLIPMNVSWGSLKYYSAYEFPQLIEFDRPQQTISVKIKDTDNNLRSLNGSEWVIAIRRL